MPVFVIYAYIIFLVVYWKNLAVRIPLLVIGGVVVFLVTWLCYKCHHLEPDDEDREKDSSQPTATFTAPTARPVIDHVTRDGIGDDDMIILPMPDEETHNFVTDTNVTELDNRVPDNDHVVDLVISNKDWWIESIDTGATRHVCFDRNLFVEYKEFENDEDVDLSMCNVSKEATSLKAMGEGKVVLKFTSGQEVTLNQVLHVPNARKNLISGSMLCKEGFRMIVESNNLVLKKGEMYVGIARLTDGWIIIEN